MEDGIKGTDFRLPLLVNALFLTEVPTQTGKEIKLIKYRVMIQWRDIVIIEDFVKYWLMPDSESKVNIITNRNAVYVVNGRFEEVAEMWREYKLWEANRKIFNLN